MQSQYQVLQDGQSGLLESLGLRSSRPEQAAGAVAAETSSLQVSTRTFWFPCGFLCLNWYL